MKALAVFCDRYPLATGTAGTSATFASWYFQHVAEINFVLQSCVLILGVATGAATLWFAFTRDRRHRARDAREAHNAEARHRHFRDEPFDEGQLEKWERENDELP